MTEGEEVAATWDAAEDAEDPEEKAVPQGEAGRRLGTFRGN
jgi:hypothetical protein